MKKTLIICSIVCALTVAVVAGAFYYKNFIVKGAAPTPTPEITQTETNNENDNVAVTTPEVTETLKETAIAENQNANTEIVNNANNEVTKTESVVPPMDNFLGRITLNKFGNEPSKTDLPSGQYSDLSCSGGKNYAGFHTANDLEVTVAERRKPVPVYSIADGTVRQASAVNGYGGLVVIEYKINGATYTAYYGHIDLKTVSVKTGSKVAVGEKIAELAPGCSSANGNTRKHLHFGLHKGSAVVVSGYVTDKKSLSNWVDARNIIK